MADLPHAPNATNQVNWPVVVGALFLAFLIGNVFRALSVNDADNFWKKWRLCKRRLFEELCENPSEENWPDETAFYTSLFPYPELVLRELEAMKQSILKGHPLVSNEIDQELAFARPAKPPDEITKPPDEITKGPDVIISEIWHSTYNCWKAELCRESAATFEYTQELEGRVRLFAAMMWASLLGFLAGVIGLLLCRADPLKINWAIIMLIMVIVSALICFIFGSQLHRVRWQEVRTVFIAYVSLTLNNHERRIDLEAGRRLSEPKTDKIAINVSHAAQK